MKQQFILFKKQSKINWWVKGIEKFVGFWILFTYLFLFSAVTGCVFISAFASLSYILVGITSSAIEL